MGELEAHIASFLSGIVAFGRAAGGVAVIEAEVTAECPAAFRASVALVREGMAGVSAHDGGMRTLMVTAGNPSAVFELNGCRTCVPAPAARFAPVTLVVCSDVRIADALEHRGVSDGHRRAVRMIAGAGIPGHVECLFGRQIDDRFGLTTSVGFGNLFCREGMEAADTDRAGIDVAGIVGTAAAIASAAAVGCTTNFCEGFRNIAGFGARNAQPAIGFACISDLGTIFERTNDFAVLVRRFANVEAAVDHNCRRLGIGTVIIGRRLSRSFGLSAFRIVGLNVGARNIGRTTFVSDFVPAIFGTLNSDLRTIAQRTDCLIVFTRTLADIERRGIGVHRHAGCRRTRS